MKTIWNEGRVVGYSAYEIYVRHHYTVDPDTPPASEQEWLSSMLGMGASMLLRIGTDNIDGDHYIEVNFPENSRLCAASNIIASFFDGDGYIGDSPDATYTGWAERVMNYGRLLLNSSADSSPESHIPPTGGEVDPVDDSTYNQIAEYLKITDGVVIQPGTWTVVENTSNRPPYKDLIPELSKTPKLRIAVSDKITTPFFILLTGFTDRGIVSGMVSTSGSVSTNDPQNGDFLGPAVFPWAAKVLFSVPPVLMSMLNSYRNSYTRILPNDVDSKTLATSGIIDIESSGIEEYYAINHTESPIDVEVIAIETPAPVLTVFQASNSVSPALYCAQVSDSDTSGIDNKMYPIDVVSPGTLKLYHGNIYDTSDQSPTAKSKALESNIPYNTAFVRDCQSYVVYQLCDSDDTEDSALIPVSDSTTENVQALQIYNTQYTWMFKQAPGGGSPSIDDLKNVKSFILNRQISGYVSEEFIDKYCMSYEYVSGLKEMDWKIYDLEHIFFGMVSQLESKGIADRYVYFMYSANYKHDIVNQQYYLVPVDKYTNQISIMIPNAKDIVGLNEGIDFYTSNKLDYLGSWFSGTEDADTDQNTRSYGVDLIIKNHPIQSVAIRDVNVFYQPNAIVPNPPRDQYKYDYLQWLKDVPIIDMIALSDWDTLGIHESYKSCSVHEFIMLSAIRNVSMDRFSSDGLLTQSASSLSYTQYIISKSAIEQTISGGIVDDTRFNTPLVADLRMSAKFSSSDYFAPQSITFESVDSENIVIDNVTNTYVSFSNTVWSSVCKSGHHVTKSISLVDSFGIPLPLVGSADTISSDKITWLDLLVSLNHNKSVDIIGDGLKDIKSAMSDPDFPTNVVYGIKKNDDGRFVLVEIT